MAADPFLVWLSAISVTASKSHTYQSKPAPLLTCTSVTAATSPRDEPARCIVRFRLPDSRGWATAIGAPGDARADLLADLRGRWPDVEIKA